MLDCYATEIKLDGNTLLTTNILYLLAHRPTYFIWYLALWQKIYHVYLAEVEVQAVVLEAGTDIIVAATSYAHL